MSAAETAKLVVTALVKPWDAIEKIGYAGINWLGDRVQGEPKERYQRLAQQIEQNLSQLPSHEVGARERMNAAISMAGALFAEDGLTTDELIRHRLDRHEAIKEQRGRFDERLESRDEPEASLCRQHVIPAIFDALFADPASLEEIDLAFKQAVLEHLGDVQRLPEENAAALKRLAAQALVRKPYRRLDPDRLAPSALLEAAYAIVPFEGREGLLDDAVAWCADERSLGIRLYVGPGGMGKTRFAIELCDQVRTHMPEQGWRSGFLARGFAGVPEWLLPNLRDGREPLLIVVDYAETKPGDLIKLLALAHDLPGGRKLRLLLLARSAGDWWSDLPATTVRDGHVIDDDARAKARAILPGPAVEQPISLGPLAPEAHERHEVFKRALAAFQAVRPHRDAAPMPDLSGDDFRSVLMIHMAALAAVEGRTIADAGALLQATLQRERGAWERTLLAPSLNRVSAMDVQQAMALITLAGGASNRSSTSDIIARAPRLQGAPRALLQDLGNVLSGLYPNPLRANDQRSRPIEPLRPDLLGEELVDRALSDDPELLKAAFGEGVSSAQIRNGLTALTRLAQRRPDAEPWLAQALASDFERLAEPAIQVAVETGHPMGTVLSQALEAHPLRNPSSLEPLIPKKTTELLGVGVVVMTQQWNRVLATPTPWHHEVTARAAAIAHHLANRLSANGQHQQALATAWRAVDLYRVLADKAPNAYRPDLASALNNLAIFLGDVGQRREALEPAREAANLYRELAIRAPDDFRSSLAMSLNTLAAHLRQIGPHKEAFAALHEVASLYRALAERAPHAYRPDLAMVLNNLAIFLTEEGQRQEALAPAQEAAALYRELADGAPDAYRPDLASALNNLANRLSDIGQCQKALAPAKEAVAIRRELVAKAPAAYRADLASALNNLAILLGDVGQCHEALAPAQEAVAIRRELAEKAPDAYLPDLAMSLSNLADCLVEAGQPQQALAPAKEAVAIRRALVAAAPDAHRSDLASALTNLAKSLSALGKHQHALAPAHEAANLYRALAEEAPDAWRPYLAGALTNLSTYLSSVGQRHEALAPAREAVAIRRELAEKAPDAYRPDLASALSILAKGLSEHGQRQDALAPAQEAVAIRRELAESAPGACRADLAMTLTNLAVILGDVGKHQEALASAQEAVAIRRKLAERLPKVYLPALAMSLNTLVIGLNAVGEPQQALTPAKEAVTIYRALAERAPDAYRPDLAMVLNNLASFLSTFGERQEALQVAEEAVRTLAPQFLGLPAAFGSLMVKVVRTYQKRCHEVGSEPDRELLAPILDALGGVEADAGGSQRQ